MSKATISILVFGVYLVLLSAILILAPNVLLWFFGIPPTNEVWIRVAGVLALILGFYYLQPALRRSS